MVEAGGYDVVVTDALIPFVPSLRAWGQSEETIDQFLRELREILAPARTVLVYLDGDPSPALSRAAEREGPDWLTWYITKLSRCQVTPAVHDIDSACGYLRREREVTLRLAGRQPWDLVRIDNADQLPRHTVQETAVASLTQLLGGGPTWSHDARRDLGERPRT